MTRDGIRVTATLVASLLGIIVGIPSFFPILGLVVKGKNNSDEAFVEAFIALGLVVALAIAVMIVSRLLILAVIMRDWYKCQLDDGLRLTQRKRVLSVQGIQTIIEAEEPYGELRHNTFWIVSKNGEQLFRFADRVLLDEFRAKFFTLIRDEKKLLSGKTIKLYRE